MSDTAADNAKRSHGSWWWFSLLPIAYVASAPFVVAFVRWRMLSGLPLPGAAIMVIACVYWPLEKLSGMLGMDGLFMQAVDGIQKLLPPP